MAENPTETVESLRDKALQLRKTENPTNLAEAEKLEKEARDLELQAESLEELEQLANWKGEWLPIKGIRVEGCINLDEKKTTATLKRMREKGGSVDEYLRFVKAQSNTSMSGGIVYLRLGKENDINSIFEKDMQPVFLDKSAKISVEANERILYILI